MQVVHDAVKRGPDIRKTQVGLRQGHFCPCNIQLGFGQGQLVGRYHIAVGQHLGILVFDLGHAGLGLRLLQVCLVDVGHDVEHLLPFLDKLAFVHIDVLQVTLFQGPEFYIPYGMDLTNVIFGNGCIPVDRAGDQEFGLLVLLFLFGGTA